MEVFIGFIYFVYCTASCLYRHGWLGGRRLGELVGQLAQLPAWVKTAWNKKYLLSPVSIKVKNSYLF